MRSRCTLAILLALASCAPADEGQAREAIEGGAIDLRDGGVVGLVITDESGYPRRTCSGTLIAPNLVLTAQHCVADTGSDVDCATSAFGPPASPARVRITTGASMWSARGAWTTASAVLAPPGPSLLCGRDLALVVLAEAISEPTFAPRLDEVQPDEAYAAVGYGAVDAGNDGAGLRRRRERLRVLCVGEGCGTAQIEAGEWRGDHGICSGDSGGPALDAEDLVLGVTSRGPPGCDRPVYGALAPHTAWLRDEARRAASAGGYPAPAWCSEIAARDPPARPRPGSCAAAPAPGPSGLWPVCAALALAGLRRRSLR